MLRQSRRAVSPQAKNRFVQKRLGNDNVERMQGSTVIVYDSLPIDGRTTFEFFREANSRAFPLTNVGAFGTLGVGDSLVIERYYLSVITLTLDPDVVTVVASVPAAGLVNVLAGQFTFDIANKITVVDMPVLSSDSRFNKDAPFADYNNFEFDTQIVLPPLLRFKCSLRVTTQPAVADTFLRLTLEGAGSIIDVKGNL